MKNLRKHVYETFFWKKKTNLDDKSYATKINQNNPGMYKLQWKEQLTNGGSKWK